jgi:hypothetical protein
MKCPEGLRWVPDREFCSRCPEGQAWNAEWNECVGVDRSVKAPGVYHTATAALFGWSGLGNFGKEGNMGWMVLVAVGVISAWLISRGNR